MAERARSVGNSRQGRYPEPMTAVLIVDDDESVRRTMRSLLAYEGFTVELAADGDEALHMLGDDVDLAIVDLELGSSPDGLVITSSARSKGIPVLVLTGRDDIESEVDSFRAGADDFIVKPIDYAVFLMRVASVLRRREVGDRLEIGDLIIDRRLHQVTRRGNLVELTAHEYKVLVLLAQHRSQVLSKAQVLEQVWGHQFVSENAVEQRVAGLRRKLMEFGPDPIVTVRTFGYRLA